MILNRNDIFESSAGLVTSEPYQSWQDLVMARVRPSQIKTPELYSSASRHRVVAIALVFVLHASLEQALGSNPIEIISLLAGSKSSVTFIATAISIPRPGSFQWTSSPLLLVLLLPRGSNASGGRRHRININFHQQAGHGGRGPHQHHQSSPLSLPLTKMALAHLSKLEREKGSRSRGEKASLESEEYSRSEESSQSRSDPKTGPILGHRMMGSESAEGQESEETSESESDSGDGQDESESDSSDQQDESKPSSEYESDSKEDSKSESAIYDHSKSEESSESRGDSENGSESTDEGETEEDSESESDSDGQDDPESTDESELSSESESDSKQDSKSGSESDETLESYEHISKEESEESLERSNAESESFMESDEEEEILEEPEEDYDYNSSDGDWSETLVEKDIIRNL